MSVDSSEAVLEFDRQRRRAVRSRPLSLLLSCISLSALPLFAAARPESIRPGHSYYSDEYVERELIRDIASEKNYEEAYERYNYYEAIYDGAGRVTIFREYKRGQVIRVERYHYGPDGTLSDRVVEAPGDPPEAPAPSPSRE